MMSATSIRDRIIVALDVSSMDEAERLLQQLQGSAVYFKVGMELFYAAGPNIIHSLKERELKVFLDLKCHDIPNTVRGAMRSMAQLGVDMVNFHVSGGRRMMEAALEGLEEGAARGKQRPLIIGVTQLTSTSQEMLNREIGIQGTVGRGGCALCPAGERRGFGRSGGFPSGSSHDQGKMRSGFFNGYSGHPSQGK